MNNIPEGATHKSGFNDAYYKKIGLEWFCAGQDSQEWNMSNFATTAVIKLNLTPIKKAKEMIYTKQMQEAGECPRLGMSFMFKGGSNDYIAKVIGLAIGSDHIQVVTFEYTDKIGLSGVECAFFDKSLFHSIDTRTDKEKAIDAISNVISNFDNNSFEEDAEEVLECIKAGKIHGIAFTGDK